MHLDSFKICEKNTLRKHIHLTRSNMRSILTDPWVKLRLVYGLTASDLIFLAVVEGAKNLCSESCEIEMILEIPYY